MIKLDPQTFKFIPCLSTLVTLFEPNSHPLSLVPLLCHSGPILGSQLRAAPANLSPIGLQPSPSTQSVSPPPSCHPIFANLLNYPNLKTRITATGFPWSTCQKESGRERKNSTIVPQQIMSLFFRLIWFSYGPETVVWLPLWASKGQGLIRGGSTAGPCRW